MAVNRLGIVNQMIASTCADFCAANREINRMMNDRARFLSEHDLPHDHEWTLKDEVLFTLWRPQPLLSAQARPKPTFIHLDLWMAGVTGFGTIRNGSFACAQCPKRTLLRAVTVHPWA